MFFMGRDDRPHTGKRYGAFRSSGCGVFMSWCWTFRTAQPSAGLWISGRSFTARSKVLWSMVWTPPTVEPLSPGFFPLLFLIVLERSALPRLEL